MSEKKLEFKEFMMNQASAKPWKAKKKETLQMWRSLPNFMPLKMNPVSETHKGSRFGEDGLRITGSPAFIQSVLSRLKDLMEEDKRQGIRLDIEYRAIQSSKQDPYSNQNYVFYAHLVQDTDKKIKKI